MNAPLRRVAISVLVLFTLLILNANYIQVVRSDELRTDSGNTRVLVDEYGRERGAIVVSGNEVARSVPTDDRLEYLREYPEGPVYAAVTGHYSVIYGSTRMENAANEVLAGNDPRLTFRRLSDLFTGRDPAGGDVVLTVDPVVQKASMAGLEGVTGAVVSLNPETGAVLGLASTPTYDPNQLSSHDPAAIRAYAEELDAQEPSPLANQAIGERYPPGSVFKVIVSAAALEDGRTPETVVAAPDVLTLPNTRTELENFGGSECAADGEQPLIDALTVSCNTAFAQLGIDLGEDRIRETAEAFGMDGEEMAIPLDVAASGVGDIGDDAALGVSSIGQQDVVMTPLQAAMVAAAVANDGVLMQPYMVDQVRAPDLTVIDQTEPEVKSEAVSGEVAGQLTEMMLSVVENGSGQAAQIPGVQVAGKTGTAENAGPDHNWFVGFAPADDPKIAVAVFIANGGGTGGELSAPIARDVIAAYLERGELMALATGSLLAGRYEIVSAVATGGMGEVWRARDRVLDRIVAAKVLRSEYTSDPSFLARFRNEARHTAALTHPNIASVYDYGETTDETGTQKLAFLVMEFVEGQPLVSILHDEGRLPVDWTLHVLAQSAEGLSAAHRGGVVHRDIKPGNLIVRPDGVVKLTDFGIAQARDATPLTKTGMVVGTAQYLSPEQAQGMEVDSASDVYSLGVVAYECLAGVRPFDGASQVAIALAHINRPPPPLPADVPASVRLLVERALAKDPADRFPDGAAFAEAIHRVAAGGSLAAAGVFAAPGTSTTMPQPAVTAADGRTQVIPVTGPGLATGAVGAVAGSATGAGRLMPPLHAPGDDLDDFGDDPPPEDRRRRIWLWVTLGLLLLLLVAGGGYYVTTRGDGEGNGTQTTTSAATTASVAGFAFDPADYVGENVDEAAATLREAQLEVTTEPATGDQLAAAGIALDANDVAATTPGESGSLAPGEDVVLYYAEAAYVPDAPAPATTTESAPTTTTAEQTTTAAPTTTTAAPTTTTATTTTTTTATTTTAAGSAATTTPSATATTTAAAASASAGAGQTG